MSEKSEETDQHEVWESEISIGTVDEELSSSNNSVCLNPVALRIICFILRIVCAILAIAIWFCLGFGYILPGATEVYLWFVSAFGFLVSVSFILNFFYMYHSTAPCGLVEMVVQLETTLMYFVSSYLLIKGIIDLKRVCDKGRCFSNRHILVAASVLATLLMILHLVIAMYLLRTFAEEQNHKTCIDARNLP